jgi:anti-anti-sigma factor
LLRVTVRHQEDDLVVLTAHGEIDLSNTWMLDSELSRYEHVPRLVIDLSGLDFCGVSGARLLQTAVTRSVVTGQQVAIVHSAAVARVLDATGLSVGLPLRTQAELDIEQAERGLRGYAHQVAAALGCPPRRWSPGSPRRYSPAPPTRSRRDHPRPTAPASTPGWSDHRLQAVP